MAGRLVANRVNFQETFPWLQVSRANFKGSPKQPQSPATECTKNQRNPTRTHFRNPILLPAMGGFHRFFQRHRGPPSNKREFLRLQGRDWRNPSSSEQLRVPCILKKYFQFYSEHFEHCHFFWQWFWSSPPLWHLRFLPL